MKMKPNDKQKFDKFNEDGEEIEKFFPEDQDPVKMLLSAREVLEEAYKRREAAYFDIYGRSKFRFGSIKISTPEGKAFIDKKILELTNAEAMVTMASSRLQYWQNEVMKNQMGGGGL